MRNLQVTPIVHVCGNIYSDPELTLICTETAKHEGQHSCEVAPTCKTTEGYFKFTYTWDQ